MILEENKYYTDGDAFVKLLDLSKSDSNSIYGNGVRKSTRLIGKNNRFHVEALRSLTEIELNWLQDCLAAKSYIPFPSESHYEVY